MTTPTTTAFAVAAYMGVALVNPIAWGASAAMAQDLSSEVHAVVVDHETGAPIADASVTLSTRVVGEADPGTQTSNQDGLVHFAELSEGWYGLVVSANGFYDMVDSIQVPRESDLEYRFSLSMEPVVLYPEILGPLGPEPAYEERRRRGAGFLITRQDILDRRVRFISELFHEVPGGMVIPAPPYGYRLLLRGQCAPGIWVDGIAMPGARSVDQVVRPGEIDAVEVYHALELPVEYGTNQCGGILVWTRQGYMIPVSAGGAEGGSRLLGGLVRIAAIVAVVFVIAR